MFDIVVIEDESEIGDLLALVLKHEEIRLHFALDGTEGLDLVRAVAPQIILLDLMLPGEMDGWDVYRVVREDASFRETPIIILTVITPQAERLHGFTSSDIDLYLLKPFDTVYLRRSVERLLGRSGLWKPPDASVAHVFDPMA
ncbi:MAG TPA: response regulator [Aggregatilinea sp.]|uniref:response regulator transcription factor n=1 Tax=Aggregatilinea sp. TaxID=2806333 RepID=UPI002BBA8415|nr:response regulator [Aggregatilinea sp.]HML24855.1 response regulator [Aggregatilinea sp.]